MTENANQEIKRGPGSDDIVPVTSQSDGHTEVFQQGSIFNPASAQAVQREGKILGTADGAVNLDVALPPLPVQDRSQTVSPSGDKATTGTIGTGTTPEKITPPKGQDTGSRNVPQGTDTRTVNAPVTSGDVTVPAKAHAPTGEQPRLNQPVAQATDIGTVKAPVEVKPSGDTPVVKPAGDATGGMRNVSGATEQATPQTKPAGTIPASADPVRGDATVPKSEATGAKVETTGARLDVPAATTAGSHVAATKPDGGVASVPKLDGPVAGAQTIKPNLDAPVSATGTVLGQKQDSVTKPALADGGQSLPGGQVRPDGIKGDYISTQAFTGPAGRQDATRGLDSNPAQAKLNEPGALKDAKLGGTSEAGGQRSETGLRGEQAGLRGDQGGLQAGGIKQDSKNPDSMIRSIEGKVDGAKQPTGTEGRVLGAENANPGIKQPGTTDSAAGVRSPSIDGGGKPQGTADGIGTKSTAGADGTSSAGRQPGQEIGGKGSGGGSATVAGESTKRIDIGGPGGGRSDGQPGGAGMGGGSSAPIDRAPHKPFGVEDAQGAASKGIAAETKGITADAKGITADAKGGTASQGVAPRFDTGETRGTELGQRFDTPELRGGKSGAAGGGGTASDFGGAKGTDVGIGKGADAMGGKGGAGGGTGFSGSGESSILGDKRQPPIIPDGVVTQAGKGGKGIDGIIGGPRADDSVPFILPGALGGKEGGRRQSDQIFADKTKAETPPAKPDAQRPDGFTAQKFAGQKPDSSSSSGSGVPGGKDGDRGQKADVGIPAAIPGQAAAEMGGALKNFAQNVLSEGKDKGVKAGESTGIRAGDSAGAKAGDVKDTKGSPKSPITDGGKGPITGGRQDFAGPGQKTRFLDAEQKNPGDQFVANRAVGPGGSGATADKKLHGAGEGATPGMDGGDEPKLEDEVIPIEEFELPQVDLLAEAEEVEEVSEEFEKTTEAKLEDEMHYELALGLQLYTSIAQAPYGAYHYHTKDGDTVETVARDIVGDVRTAPLVFSLNKDHIIASTEYGTHPFKSGVMIQLPTPRDLKDFFGQQQ